MKDRRRVENSRGMMETIVTMECGHEYKMGVYHNCNVEGCPARLKNK